ncbi:MAG: ATP-binding protein [Chloroflexi bacterium]|nr:ATP-binding protein [Chloroflexota bacterium]
MFTQDELPRFVFGANMTSGQIASSVVSVGHEIATINVTIGPRFLNLFSEQLYSSPNKAFEELVSNSWDAGAQHVYIGVPANLDDSSAAVWVLDDGESMDLKGLQILWHVAESPKRNAPAASGRPQIGKFGIGKLSTYILADEVTYVCKSGDGLIRAVTMDYRRIDEAAGSHLDLSVPSLGLGVRVIEEKDLGALLADLPAAKEILELISNGVPKPKSDSLWNDDYGADTPPPTDNLGTWTLVLLTHLKPKGRAMQAGWIRRILRTALPLGSTITIVFNEEALWPSKIEKGLAKEWRIGPGLGIPTISIPGDSDDEEVYRVTEADNPVPHVTIEGMEGQVTGFVRLYEDSISGGKSEALGFSNGFFVNIYGRVVNSTDPYFGLDDLSHTVWSKFRATIRADGLDDQIAVNREELQETESLRIFKGFLRAIFNKARVEHTKLIRAAWADVGDALVESWNAMPIEPLHRIVLERLENRTDLPEFIEVSGDVDEDKLRNEWDQTAKDRPGALINNVLFESSKPEDPLVHYDVHKRQVLVNSSHPFAVEHFGTVEQQQLLRDTALIELLTDAYMVDIGINDDQVHDVREYRDQVLRTIARVNRQSGGQIASMLMDATSHAKALEHIVGDALDYLGLSVRRLGQHGQPEGVATAPVSPKKLSMKQPDKIATYSFTYDAKSTTKRKAKTANLTIAGLKKHRIDEEADYTLMIAPDYQVAELLLSECEQNQITPMRAGDLARLVMLTAATGPIDLELFREIFAFTNPDDVGAWVKNLIEKTIKEPRLSLDLFFQALNSIGYTGPNAIHTSLIADRIAQASKGKVHPNRVSLNSLVSGLQVLVPNLIRLSPDGTLFLSTSPEKLRSAIQLQISEVPEEIRFGLGKQVS